SPTGRVQPSPTPLTRFVFSAVTTLVAAEMSPSSHRNLFPRHLAASVLALLAIAQAVGCDRSANERAIQASWTCPGLTDTGFTLLAPPDGAALRTARG